MRCSQTAPGIVSAHPLSLLAAQVIKYESVIHEFDPYFNFRVTQV